MKSQRTLFSYAYLRSIGYHVFKQAEENERGRSNNCIIAMLFMAFSLEAYFNHLGAKKVSYWAIIERKLSPKEKLNLLSEAIGYNINWEKRPFQTFIKIFRFRDTLVHAKTQHFSIADEQILINSQDPSLPLSSWEKMANLKTAERFLKDSEEIITILHSKAKLGDYPLAITSESTYLEI